MTDDPTDSPSSAASPESGDEFEGLVLDENFVRGGSYEPPARTRVAIARYGGQQTSWRHGGGLRRGQSQPDDQPTSIRANRTGQRRGGGRRPRQPSPARGARPALPSPWLARLPIIITAVVVAVAAFMVFR